MIKFWWGAKKPTHTIIAVSWSDCGVGNDPIPSGLAFHHQGSTFINAYCPAAMNLSMHVVKPQQTWLVETEGNMGLMICLGKGGLHSLSASRWCHSFLCLLFVIWFSCVTQFVTWKPASLVFLLVLIGIQ